MRLGERCFRSELQTNDSLAVETSFTSSTAAWK
jgi:hypothetical protein